MTFSCEWKLTFDVHHHDPAVYIYTGTNILIVPGEIDEFNTNGFEGVRCAAFYQIANGFGGALAEAELDSTSCNTDGFVRGESSVTVIDGALKSGPAVPIAPNQQQWYGSFVLGADVLIGEYTFCSQDPIGQHNSYACIQFDAGPFI